VKVPPGENGQHKTSELFETQRETRSEVDGTTMSLVMGPGDPILVCTKEKEEIECEGVYCVYIHFAQNRDQSSVLLNTVMEFLDQLNDYYKVILFT
jgi:hypothetical protein